MTVRRKRLWFAAALSALLIGGPLALRQIPSPSVTRSIRISYPHEFANLGLKEDDLSVKTLFDGEAGLATVAAPDRLEISCVGDVNVGSATGARSEVYPLVRGPITVPDPAKSIITSALLSPHSYFWGVAKNCDPQYHICLSFYRGSDRIDAFLCLGCRMMLVAHNGRAVYVENIDFAQPTLLRTTKSLFPSDRMLQLINELDDTTMNELRDFKKRAAEVRD